MYLDSQSLSYKTNKLTVDKRYRNLVMPLPEIKEISWRWMIFPISNVYWIGISRHEEGTTLFAIKNDEIFVGLIGVGYDEDGVSGYINPLMIDEKHQGKGYSRDAMILAIEKLKNDYRVPEIHIGHRKNNIVAGKLYESLGFSIVDEDENDYFRKLDLK